MVMAAGIVIGSSRDNSDQTVDKPTADGENRLSSLVC